MIKTFKLQQLKNGGDAAFVGFRNSLTNNDVTVCSAGKAPVFLTWRTSYNVVRIILP